MRDDVLLTCCPPAPDERDARISSSERGIAGPPQSPAPFARRKTLSPSEKVQRSDKADHEPAKDHRHLEAKAGEMRSLEHVRAERIVHRGERERP